jgi:periplasmic protein TonB
MFLKRKQHPNISPEGTWFPSWPLFSSLLLHGFLAYFLMTWTFSPAPESVTRIVMVQIVEEKQEKPPVPPAPVRPKPKKVQEIVRPRPAPQPVVPRKEEEAPSPVVYQAAEQKVPEVLQVHEEKIGVEEKPKEKGMEKAEPGRWGTPEGPQDAEPLRLGKEKPPISLTADSGSAQKGIPGGIASVNPWGKGAGGEAGFPGGVEGGKGTVPPKGAKTGGVYFQGKGKGRGDLGSYLGHARMRIEKAKRYPREARRRGWEGKVVLSFQINLKGEVAQIRLVQSSGYQELDEEGIATLRRASPFSPPPWAEEEKLEVQIPLVFRLEEGR